MSENKENKVYTIRDKCTILDNRDDQLEVLLKQIAYLMYAIERKNFKRKNIGDKFSMLMKNDDQVIENGQKKG